MSWRIELSPAAVDALRALPRKEQEYVALRIRHLEDAGLPQGAEGACPVPAGDQTLMCVADPEGRRIVVVTLLAAEASAPRSVGALIRRRIRHWTTNVMGGGGMGSVLSDLRFALRGLRRSPGFAVTAVLTLALGIGATASIFSVANGVLLSPLPYGDADEVVTVWSSWSNFPDKTWVSEAEYRYYYQENRTLDDIALYQTFNVNFTAPENPERVGAAAITPNTIAVLGVEPALGRAFSWDEAMEEDPVVVMLGYGLWMRRFGGDPGIVGRDVQVNGRNRTVVGVLPEGFVLPVDYGSPSVSEVFYPYPVDVETPVQMPPGGGSHGSYSVARLAPGETVESALADLTGLIGRLEAEFPPERAFQPRVYAVKSDILGPAQGTILVLLGAVGFVLLIACGNVANLLLSRSEVRLREVAVRTALGAGRARIFRQLLTESLVLAGVGGAVGLVFAAVGVDALLAVDPDAVPRSGAVALDGTVVAFTLVVSGLTAILFGVMPALRVTRGKRAGASLHDGSRGGGGGARSNRTQGLLVAAQMAMAVVLLTASGLMMKTFVELLRVDPGFQADEVLTLRVTTPGSTYADAPAVAGFYEELLRRVREIPGVRAAGAARILPLASTMGDAGFRPAWYQRAPNESTQADWQWATPGYFEAMGLPLVAGRTFDQRDGPDGQPVVVINQSLARRYWGDEDPLGAEVHAFGGDTAVVVGIVGDVRHNGIIGDVKDRYYRPHSQIERALGTMRSMTLTVAAHGSARALLEPVRREIRALDPSMPINEVATMDEVLSATVAQPRFAMTLLATFAALALALAVVGVYGVLAYAVSQRTQEIGIRLALGAERTQVVGMVVRQGMLMALAGVAAGTAAAWFATDLMQAMLYNVTPQDLTTFLAVPVVFSAVALLACWLPAVRAARVRPARALRYE